MDAPTRGCAPGYDVWPLRGDHPACTASPADAAIPPPEIYRPLPTAAAPKGHNMPAQGQALE